MASGGKQGFRVGALGMLALVAALVAPGVRAVSAQPAPALPVPSAEVPSRESAPVEEARIEVSEPAVATALVSAPVAVAKPRHLRRLKQPDLNGDLITASAALIKKHHSKRFGSEIEVQIAGKPYVARIERHYHPEGGPIKPWGFHPGVSLFAVE